MNYEFGFVPLICICNLIWYDCSGETYIIRINIDISNRNRYRNRKC